MPFSYLERIQGVLEEVPRGPTGPLGPVELAALSRAASSSGAASAAALPFSTWRRERGAASAPARPRGSGGAALSIAPR